MENAYESNRREWRPSIEDDPVSVNIENRLHVSAEIDTNPADIEDIENYEKKVGDYKAKGFTYIPLPGAWKYYNTEEGWIRDLDSSQFIDEDTHLMEVLKLLQEEPFLLVDYESASDVMIHEDDSESVLLHPESHQDKSYASREDTKHIENVAEIDTGNIVLLPIGRAKEKHPSLAEAIDEMAMDSIEYQEDRYGIITLADVNRRGMKIMIYVVFSGLVSRLSHKIEEEYPNSESIFKYLRAETIGRWHKDRIEGLELHVAEHMNLIGIMQVIQSSDKTFVEDCGFDSKDAVTDLNSINEIRNKVMHANRSLIYDRRDIQDILSAVDRAQEIVTSMN